MKLRSPAWIIVAGAVVVQATGGLSMAGSTLIGIDNAIKAIVDINGLFTKVVIKPIKPVVIPKKKVAKQ